MSHHSSRPNQEMSELMKQIMGEYPNGRLNEDDSGAIAVAICIENGAVVLQFPKPTAWIGFTPEQAIDIANTLIKKAREAGLTKPVSIRL